MRYSKRVILKNGSECLLRSGAYTDGAVALELFQKTHEQTDFLLTYPDETSFDAAREGDFLEKKYQSENEVELLAFVEGKLAGMAGISAVGSQYKLRHRAEFGVNVDQAYWGLGVGRALTMACVECAREAGYRLLELDVVRENQAAIALYESVGFRQYGCYPRAFRSRTREWQDLILMYLDLK